MGIGTIAKAVMRREDAANTAPTRMMFQKRRMKLDAPPSRKRSSWLTSSLRMLRSPPEVVSSNQPTSSDWT